MNKIYCALVVLLMVILPANSQYWEEIMESFPDSVKSAVGHGFGSNIAVSGSYAVVGMPNYKSEQGAAYVLEKTVSGWDTAAFLMHSNTLNQVMRFGTSVDIEGDYIIIGAASYSSNGAAFIFKKPLDGWKDTTESATLLSSDLKFEDYFGCAVAINEDYAVVGAHSNADSGIYTGACYVFKKSETGWKDTTEIAKLSNSNARAYSYFGWSVAISDSIIVVGARQANYGSNNNSGTAYLYKKPSTGWKDTTETAKLISSDIGFYDYFGHDIAVSGNTVAVSCLPERLIPDRKPGATYIFEEPATGWEDMTETAKLSSRYNDINDYFGRSIDMNENTVVVGASAESNEGCVYVFNKPAGGWKNSTPSATLYAREEQKDNFFGAVALSGNTIIVGAGGNNRNGGRAGCVYLFEKTGSSWITSSETQKILPGRFWNGNYSSSYGKSVAISGNTAVVGAPWYNHKQGNAYILQKVNNNWVTIAKIRASDSSCYNYFGTSVDIDGNTIVVGAEGTNSANKGGTVYVFTKPANGWKNMTETAMLKPSDSEDYDKFGCAVAVSGDAIVAGAYSNDENGSYSGKAYVFEKPVSGWTNMSETGILTPSDVKAKSYFGVAVDVYQNTIIVGAHQQDTGAAYIYEKPHGGWVSGTETAKLTASNGDTRNYFGESVSIWKNTVVVGASGHQRWGTSYVFEKPAAGWANMNETSQLRVTDDYSRSSFGSSIAISDDYIVVGDERASQYPNFSHGAAFVYKKTAEGSYDTIQSGVVKSLKVNANDILGTSVAISDGTILIGAPGNDNYGHNAGIAFFYEKIYNPIAITEQPTHISADCDGEFVKYSITASNVEKYRWQVKLPGSADFTDVINTDS
ncbi:MAG: FG-GAP repeat protein, partial [Bacteroidales bacterium]|nr:FG-GAP repeat protein [Bacteroidales bacterium]